MSKKKPQIGRLTPRYAFAINPYPEERVSRCPRCKGLTYMRKFPLVIHLQEAEFVVLGKTCRYCAKCEFIIAHQLEIEAELASRYRLSTNSGKRTDYTVFGTMSIPAWKKSLHNPIPMQEALRHVSDFKEYRTISAQHTTWAPAGKRSQ